MTALGLEGGFGSTLGLDSQQIYQALILSLVLGLVVALVYRFTVKDRLTNPQFQLSLVLLGMVAAMVMMVIGNNVARAFSLVGALAIIRFRTRLRSPLDITFVFLALSVGIACGVLAFRVAIVGTVTISLASVGLSILPLAGLRNPVRLLRVDLSAHEGGQQLVDAVLQKRLTRQWLQEARSMRFGETISLRYRVVLKNDDQWPALLRELSELEGVERVVIHQDEDEGGPDEGA